LKKVLGGSRRSKKVQGVFKKSTGFDFREEKTPKIFRKWLEKS
jgi:hypothetical protein